MAQAIGIVKLAPGEVGFYDEISRIHLTISRPQAEVYDYMNTAKLVRAVRNKVLVLVAGSLNAARVMNEEPVVKTRNISAPVVEEKVEIAEPQVAMFAEEIVEPKVESLIEIPVVEEMTEVPATQEIVEEATIEEVVENEIQEEVVEIEQPKKKATKKKK